MRERGALGKAGGAAGELDVDRIIRPERVFRLYECCAIGFAQQRCPRQETLVRVLADGHDAAQAG